MSMSIAYAMMSAGEISIRSPDNIKRCLDLKTDRFGEGYVYFRTYAVTGLSRSFRFDQISETYSDRKLMKFLADSGRGEYISGEDSSLLIYVWRDEYMRIVEHNQHIGYNFVIFDPPTSEERFINGLTNDEYTNYMNEFNYY
jgi:hypothetical protein